jgi:hypothetical protein
MSPEEMEARLRTIYKASNSIGIPDHIFRLVAPLLSDVDNKIKLFEHEEDILKAVKKHLLKTPCAGQEDILDFIRSKVQVTVDVEDLINKVRTLTYYLAVARAENERLREGKKEEALA